MPVLTQFSVNMNELIKELEQNVSLFKNTEQALIYTTLLREGLAGAEKLHQHTGLHRETVQRELKKMDKIGTVQIIKTGRNRKAQAVSISKLQEILEIKNQNFTNLLKPLLEAEASKRDPRIKIYTNNHNYGLLQLKLIKLQPKNHDIEVISTHPKDWLNAMVESKKLSQFENIRLSKEVRFLLSCFSELKGQVEENNRQYFANQPPHLKRQYRYVETVDSSPLQIQVWFNCIVISIFESVPSIHIVIEDSRVAKAMKSYFNILWNIGTK
jgi:sugar-specific transcriptional regulator TrmB